MKYTLLELDFIIVELFQQMFNDPIKYKYNIMLIIDHPNIGCLFSIYMCNYNYYINKGYDIEQIISVTDSLISYYKNKWIGKYHIQNTWNTYKPCSWTTKKEELYDFINYVNNRSS